MRHPATGNLRGAELVSEAVTRLGNRPPMRVRTRRR